MRLRTAVKINYTSSRNSPKTIHVLKTRKMYEIKKPNTELKIFFEKVHFWVSILRKSLHNFSDKAVKLIPTDSWWVTCPNTERWLLYLNRTDCHVSWTAAVSLLLPLLLLAGAGVALRVGILLVLVPARPLLARGGRRSVLQRLAQQLLPVVLHLHSVNTCRVHNGTAARCRVDSE